MSNLLPNTKYAHFTVPHSGTRYINEAVKTATGFNPWQVAGLKSLERQRNRKDDRSNEDFIFCHLGQRWDDFINLVCEHDHIKTWITVREPIGTWSTHWGHMWTHQKGNGQVDYQAQYEKLGQLRGQYATLKEFLPKVGYVHRVDIDPISKLGDYLGIELKEHDQTFSNPTPMKKAIIERDLGKIESLCKGHDFWRAFHDHITPDYQDMFEELGYETWWYNGQRNAA